MLVVFDIDGTVTRTYALDQELFARAFLEVYGWRLDTDWTHYRHATDLGITEEVLGRCFGRAANSPEIESIRARYLTLLQAEIICDPQRLQVPGAGETIQKLLARGYRVAFATGSWKVAARLKLSRAGPDIDRFPFATCDDSLDRFEILRLAVSRATTLRPADNAIYVGDGPWDVASARQLGVGFIGVDCDGAARLTGLGVKHLLPDFGDFDRFMAAIEDVQEKQANDIKQWKERAADHHG
jgi:phosphoglycolate phosphatase-like HAD superfamily hydrolase